MGGFSLGKHQTMLPRMIRTIVGLFPVTAGPIAATMLAFVSVACLPSPQIALAQTDDSSRPLTPLVVRAARVVQEGQRNHQLIAPPNAAWQVFHAVTAYGEQVPLQVESRPFPSALRYVLDGGPIEGWQPTIGPPRDGWPRPGIRLVVEEGSKRGQGHPDQFLGYMAMASIPPDAPIAVEDQSLTVEDLLRQALWDAPRNPTSEFSWTLMALAAYRPTSITWPASDGEIWTVERLIEEELLQDLPTAACGGTHRLQGLAMILQRRRQEQGSFDGVWSDAQALIDQSLDDAQANQNPDGSFPPSYLYRPGRARDLGEQLVSSGHAIEFIAMAIDKERLDEPWVERGISRLCDLLEALGPIEVECGAYYHAMHGLKVYAARRAE
jgi:hypothetical protein